MSSSIRWLKASFIAGAIADGTIGIMMLIPSRMGEIEFRYSMGLAASLMFGWTLLLLWGYRKPVERKGVLALTIAVIVGLVGTGAYQFATGVFSLGGVLPTMVLGIALVALMSFSYLNAGTLRQS